MLNRPQTDDDEARIAHGIRIARTIGSPAYPAEEERLQRRVRSDYARSYYPAGFMRQTAAIIADGDRRAMLKQVTAPTLVVHGDADPLVPVAGGQDTVASIAGAKLHIIPGMGHDLPVQLVDEMAEQIANHASTAVAR